MKQVTNNSELIPDQWYWIRHKGNPNKFYGDGNPVLPSKWFISRVSEWKDRTDSISVAKYISDFVWCYDENSQALGMYDIYGPIEQPVVA